jgi:5-methylcytosine-specific restriction enzyme B
MDQKLIQLITSKMSALNKVIREDPLLGENYQIGHSYFCPNGESFAELDQAWYRSIVRTQIIPLLKEYWFDDPKKAQDAEKELLPA